MKDYTEYHYKVEIRRTLEPAGEGSYWWDVRTLDGKSLDFGTFFEGKQVARQYFNNPTAAKTAWENFAPLNDIKHWSYV